MRVFLSLLIACSLLASHTTALPRELETDTVPIPGPPPPPPEPRGDGAGAYNSSVPNSADRFSKDKITWAADEFGDDWPNARRHLRQYLSNTGDDLYVDVDGLTDSVSSLEYGAKYRKVEWGQRTFRKIRGKTGIKMFTMPWEVIAPKMNTDWYYALGAFSYSVTGRVTKYSANNGTLEYVVHIFDRYNWDGDKAVTIKWSRGRRRRTGKFAC
jgi:hypothetical protein